MRPQANEGKNDRQSRSPAEMMALRVATFELAWDEVRILHVFMYIYID